MAVIVDFEHPDDKEQVKMTSMFGPKDPAIVKIEATADGTVTFDTGATRSEESTFDLSGFVNPRVLLEFGKYMQRHRKQRDGKLRASDNWQKGMPSDRTFRSLSRHYLDLWLLDRGYAARSEDCSGKMDALCAILFNTMVLMKNQIEEDDASSARSNAKTKEVHVHSGTDEGVSAVQLPSLLRRGGVISPYRMAMQEPSSDGSGYTGGHDCGVPDCGASRKVREEGS